MRARNIKPGLFTNELLGQADLAFTVLFAGLWCMADRDGRLEDRPARLRAALFPYRHEIDIEAALIWLQHAGFIDRYNVDGLAIIQVIKFAEHQRPHSNEVPSMLPTKVTRAVRQSRKRAQPSNGQGGKRVALIPSSLIPNSPSLISDPGLRIPDPSHTALAPNVGETKYWNAIKKAWPSGNPRNRWTEAKKHADKLVADGRATWEQLYLNVRAYAELCECHQRKPLDVRNYFSESDEPWANAWDDRGIRSPALSEKRKLYDQEDKAKGVSQNETQTH